MGLKTWKMMALKGLSFLPRISTISGCHQIESLVVGDVNPHAKNLTSLSFDPQSH